MDNEKRTKARRFPPNVQRLIFTEAIKQRTVPRQFLANRLIQQIEELGEIPPTVDTCTRMISRARNEYKPLDKPWSIGSCRDYPNLFPPDSLPFLTKMQEFNRSFVNILTKERSKGFSIRTAIWIARLRHTINAYFEPDTFEEESEIVDNICQAYSLAERVSETMGEDTFDTSDLDKALCSQNIANILLLVSAKAYPNKFHNESSDIQTEEGAK